MTTEATGGTAMTDPSESNPFNNVDNKDIENPLNLNGMSFIEFASPDPVVMERLFYQFGFRLIAKHKVKEVFLF